MRKGCQTSCQNPNLEGVKFLFSFGFDHQDYCGQFADRYIELDSVVILIDMILHKPRVYRHLLFNRINYQDMGYNVRTSCFFGFDTFALFGIDIYQIGAVECVENRVSLAPL